MWPTASKQQNTEETSGGQNKCSARKREAAKGAAEAPGAHYRPQQGSQCSLARARPLVGRQDFKTSAATYIPRARAEDEDNDDSEGK